MQQPLSTNSSGWTESPMRMSTSALIAQSRRKAPKRPIRAAIDVAAPGHLCQVQATTRELCRSIDVDESSVFQAVIAVSELAHRLFIERARCGNVELSAVRGKDGLRLDVCARLAGAPEDAEVRVSLKFPLAAASPYS